MDGGGGPEIISFAYTPTDGLTDWLAVWLQSPIYSGGCSREEKDNWGDSA